MSKKERIGITAAGNWIVDRVKLLDCIPSSGMLASIRSEQLSTGGAPANVLGDLARMKVRFPLAGAGVIGNDEDGRFILKTFKKLKVDISNITITKKAPTSYTDVMTEQSTGDRAFFHCRGANAIFGPEHIPLKKLSCRIFHLGYLLLLDRMDSKDSEYGTIAARVLHDVQSCGIKTSLDIVSEESDRFRTIVPPALRFVDYLILNEIEAGRIVNIAVRKKDGKLDGPALCDALDSLRRLGKMELIAIHMPEGVLIRDKNGKHYSQGSLQLPKGFIVSAVGAGDAFCAGMLYGLHEGWDCVRSSHLGSCCAAASLSAGGATDGIKPLNEVLDIGKRFHERNPPVKV